MNGFLRRTRHLSRPVRARLSVAPPALFPSKYISSHSPPSLLGSTSRPAVTTMADFSDKGSTTSSADWSDEEGDEYLAKALASDEYLQGACGARTCCAITSPRPALGPPIERHMFLLVGVVSPSREPASSNCKYAAAGRCDPHAVLCVQTFGPLHRHHLPMEEAHRTLSDLTIFKRLHCVMVCRLTCTMRAKDVQQVCDRRSICTGRLLHKLKPANPDNVGDGKISSRAYLLRALLVVEQ